MDDVNNSSKDESVNDVAPINNFNKNNNNNIMRERKSSFRTSTHRNSAAISQEDLSNEIFTKLSNYDQTSNTQSEFVNIKDSFKNEKLDKNENKNEEIVEEKKEKEEIKIVNSIDEELIENITKERKGDDFTRFYVMFGFLIIYCWFIGYFGFGLIWLLGIVPIGRFVWKELSEISLRKAIEEHNEEDKRNNEFERASWLNNIISHLWLSFPHHICSSLSHALSERLSHSKPFFIKEVTLSDFSIGESFPKVTIIKSYDTQQSFAHLRTNNQFEIHEKSNSNSKDDFKEQNADIPLETLDKHIFKHDEELFNSQDQEKIKFGETVITVDFQLRSKTDIQFTCNATIIGVSATFPFLVSDIFLDAFVRLTLKITKTSPFIQFLRISVLKEPTLLLSIQPLKNNNQTSQSAAPQVVPSDIRSQLKQKILNVTKNVKIPDLMQIPLVSQWLYDTFVLVLKKSMRYPNYLQINMDDLTPHFSEIILAKKERDEAGLKLINDLVEKMKDEKDTNNNNNNNNINDISSTSPPKDSSKISSANLNNNNNNNNNINMLEIVENNSDNFKSNKMLLAGDFVRVLQSKVKSISPWAGDHPPSSDNNKN